MEIIKLTSEHTDLIRPFFMKKNHMGIVAETKAFVDDEKPFSDFFHESFVSAYLSGLNNYHAFGMIKSGKIHAIIGFYQSIDEASWFGHHIKSLGEYSVKPLVDKVIDYNEKLGLLKFYTMFPIKYIKSYRRLTFSKFNNERYDYFDEFYVPSKHQCVFTLPWQILYNRMLLPVDTVVRCTFLKQKYRKNLINAGRI